MTAPFTPIWLTPSAPGQLSNKRGTNTGADALTLSSKYVNPRATGDLAGTVRVVANRTFSSGASQNVVDWDSGWVGASSTSPAPDTVSTNKLMAHLSVQYNGRIYEIMTLNQGTVAAGISLFTRSAPVSGGSVGSWRTETPWVSIGHGVPVPYSATVAAGKLYVLVGLNASSTGNAMVYATINGDGTLGSWTLDLVHFPTNTGALIGGQMSATATVPNQGFLLCIGSTSAITAVVTVSVVGLNADGSLQSWVTSTALPAARSDFGFFIDLNVGYVVIAGGYDTTPAAVATIYIGTLNLSTVPGVSAWNTQTNALPTARARMGIAVNQEQQQYIYCVGGTTTVADTGALTEIRAATISNTLGVGQIGAWSAALLPALPVALSRHFAFISSVAGSQNGFIIAGTGRTITPTDNFTVYTISQFAGLLSGAWASGAGSGLTAGNLGTGGALVNNPDGTQTCTFNLGAFGSSAFLTLVDGDQITVTIQFTDINNGDPSPIVYTVVKIGQAPTISNIAVNVVNDGRPLITFNYTAGAGGDLEFSYRVSVAPNGFDSGIRYDSANSVQVLSAPYWVNAVQQTITVTVVSRDSPIAGASNSATSTLNTTPALGVVIGTPTGLTVTPNHAGGYVALAWTNNVSLGVTPGNRVYYRRNGTSTWFLLADFASQVTSCNLIDQIALGVAYDFAVSQVDNSNHSEGLLNTVLNKTIDPVAGGYSGFIHIQGNPSNGSWAGTHFAPLLVQGTPDVTAQFDTTATLPFQQLTPTVTLGVAHYAKLGIPILVPSLTNQKQIMDVLATAYLGNVIIYRDGFGGMSTFQISPEQITSYIPPVARVNNLKMTQIPNQFQPSTTQGLATGYLQQVFNSITPLDPIEAFL